MHTGEGGPLHHRTTTQFRKANGDELNGEPTQIQAEHATICREGGNPSRGGCCEETVSLKLKTISEFNEVIRRRMSAPPSWCPIKDSSCSGHTA